MSAANYATVDITTICAILRSARYMIQAHPNNGRTDVEGGEMLSDVTSILIDVNERLEELYSKVDVLESDVCASKGVMA